jgi:hypothetical protein
MQRVSNKNASAVVAARQEFKGSHTFGEWDGDNYVAYSYGKHFPMYVYSNGEWFENSDKYSVSTSKQQTQLRPTYHTTPKTTEELKQIIRGDKPQADPFSALKLVCAFGQVLNETQEEKNAWDKRMLSTQEGIQFPSDWDTLSEEEKAERLEKAKGVL